MGPSMRQARHRSASFVARFVGLSLLVHLNVVLVIVAILSLNPEGCQTEAIPLPIEVAVVPVNATEAKRLEPEQLKKEEEKERKKDRDAKGQVVELPKPVDEQRPDKARFRSEYDSKVRHETKARPAPFRPGKLSARQALTPRRRATAQERRRLERKILKLAMRTKKVEPELPKSTLPKARDGQAQRAQPQKPKLTPRVRVEGAAKAQPGAPKKQLKLSDLKLSDEELAKAVGSRVNDALKGVDEGKHTLLNSKRWRFASFFNRVKRQVAQNWHPNIVYRRRDPRGRVYGFKDRLTILRVKLSPKGELKHVQLEKASGVGFLDDEAVRAFKLAQPFPNPPRGLVDEKTGLISFRFGFLFEISRRPSFKLFRYR